MTQWPPRHREGPSRARREAGIRRSGEGGRGHEPRNWVASRSWKRQEAICPQTLQKEPSPGDRLRPVLQLRALPLAPVARWGPSLPLWPPALGSGLQPPAHCPLLSSLAFSTCRSLW